MKNVTKFVMEPKCLLKMSFSMTRLCVIYPYSNLIQIGISLKFELYHFSWNIISSHSNEKLFETDSSTVSHLTRHDDIRNIFVEIWYFIKIISHLRTIWALNRAQIFHIMWKVNMVAVKFNNYVWSIKFRN